MVNGEELLKEARIKFKKGVRFDNSNIIPDTGIRNKISDGDPYFCKSPSSKSYEFTGTIGICYNGGNMTIYKDGNWANVIELPKEVNKELIIEIW